MTLPAIYEVAEEHPRDTFVLLTQPFMARMVVGAPINLSTHIFRKEEDGAWWQLVRFAGELHKQYPEAVVVDLHDVLRTKVLRTLLQMRGHRVVALEKPRAARRALLKPRTTDVVPQELYLPRMTDLYLETLQRAGLSVLSKGKRVLLGTLCPSRVTIGIAPYAQYQGKMITEEQTLELIDGLKARYPSSDLILYGAPGAEARKNRALVALRPQSVRMTTADGLQNEIREIAQLDCMISMDSANQHIAAMVGTPVVSVWGATHPAAGFMAFRTTERSTVGVPLECRPCSIYGDKPCHRGDYACITQLSMSQVVSAVVRAVEERRGQ